MRKGVSIPQRFGSAGDGLLYETLYQIQRYMARLESWNQKAQTIQASSTLSVRAPVVRVLGVADVKNIDAPGIAGPIAVYAENGFSFVAGNGNVRTDSALGAGDSATLYLDSEKNEWFVVGGGGPPVAGFITDGANVGGGAEVYQAKIGSILYHRTLKGTGAISVTQNTDDVTISAAAATVTGMANVGTGSEVYKGMSGTTAQIRKLNAGANISVTQNTDDITIANTSTATIGGSIASKQIAFGSGPNTIEGEAGFEYDKATNTQTVDDIWFKRPLVNVKHLGAKGDGATDDTDTIQAAIDYAESLGGATVFFPAGVYLIGKTAGTGLTSKDFVSFLGETKGKTIIEWKPISGGSVVDVGGVMLDTTGKDIHLSSFCNLVFWKNAGVTTGLVTGILGGSNTVGEYNSGTATFRDLWFVYLEYGIRGNGRGYDTVGNSKIGFFDCVFDNISYSSCNFGILTGGSGNVHIKPFFIDCTTAALVMDYISTESTSGEQLLGGTFVRGKYHVYFTDGGGGLYETYRQTNFFGTWFEGSTHGIVGYNASIGGTVIIPVFNFQGCVLQTDAVPPAGYLLDLTKVYGAANVNECIVFKNAAGHSDQILSYPGTGANYIQIRDCTRWDYLGVITKIGTDASMHATKNAAQGPIAPGGAATAITWDLLGAGAFDKESCYGGTNEYVVKYDGSYSVQVRLLVDAAAAGIAELQIVKNVTTTPVVVAITHHTFGAAGIHHLVCTADMALLVGDTISVRLYNPVVACTVIVNTAGFNNAHYNTFSVSREF